MAEYICDMTDDYPDVPYGADEYSGTVERRERVVRCRDCEHATRCAGPMATGATSVPPDGFCAWGEPREEGGRE